MYRTFYKYHISAGVASSAYFVKVLHDLLCFVGLKIRMYR